MTEAELQAIEKRVNIPTLSRHEREQVEGVCSIVMPLIAEVRRLRALLVEWAGELLRLDDMAEHEYGSGNYAEVEADYLTRLAMIPADRPPPPEPPPPKPHAPADQKTDPVIDNAPSESPVIDKPGEGKPYNPNSTLAKRLAEAGLPTPKPHRTE